MLPVTDNERRAGLGKLSYLFGLVFEVTWRGTKIDKVRVTAIKPVSGVSVDLRP